jgi:ubiquinone/menaquinone biosynthesis C-methylase UbiE
MSNPAPHQKKSAEIAFFDAQAEQGDYNVFTEAASRKIIDAFVACTGLKPPARVVDLGCGSGAFTRILTDRGFAAEGVDISPQLIALARRLHPHIPFSEGDVEALVLPDASFDGVLLSGIVHHLPHPSRCAAEVQRILKPGGWFFAFDPNRLNPFMYLYRDRSSPFYSSVGVTENERPVMAKEVARVFSAAGLRVFSAGLGGLSYRYVASSRASQFLPVYNALEALLSAPAFMSPFRPFVLTYGQRV